MRERAVQRDFGVFEDLAQRAVADPMCRGEILVVANVHRALLDDLAHGRVGEDEASAAVTELNVFYVKVLADVVRLARVEIGEIFEQVVPAEEGVGFDEDVPFRIGHF